MKFIRYELPFYILKLLGIGLTAHILYVLLLLKAEPQLALTVLSCSQVLLFSLWLFTIGVSHNLLQGKSSFNDIFQRTLLCWLFSNVFAIMVVHFV